MEKESTATKLIGNGVVYCGEVCWFSSKKGVGFISWEINGVKQTDLFVHYSAINISGFKTLFKQQKVSFKIGVNNKGQPIAIEVNITR